MCTWKENLFIVSVIEILAASFNISLEKDYYVDKVLVIIKLTYKLSFCTFFLVVYSSFPWLLRLLVSFWWWQEY